ncbi:MAG: hypothetical protein PWQ95_2045 [Thermococcaceae archaeon]|nr:hypothetical protein [Thermococcaceae archaeon]
MVIIEGPKADVETKRELVKRITEVIREGWRAPLGHNSEEKGMILESFFL